MASEVEGRSGAKARLGILFVHGIGDQPQGTALVQFGEPLVRWIQRRSESLVRRLLNAGLTYTEFKRWQAAVWDEWSKSGRKDFLRWKPLMWRFEMDAYLDAKANEKRMPNPAEDAVSPLDPGPADIQKLVDKYEQSVPAAVCGAEVTSGNLRPGTEMPAHAWLELGCVCLDGSISEKKWLLAESWWAGAFGVPSFRDLIGPSPKLIPAVVGLHFGASMRRAWRPTRLPPIVDYPLRIARVAWSVVALFFGLLLAAVALVVMFVFYPLALLPVAALRTFAAGVQRLLTATLGDSYVLVTSPVRTAAILSRIRRDLEWLAPRCERIAIVAHSQGAALTYLLLQQTTSAIRVREGSEEAADVPEWLEKLDLLFTFGSGLRKLVEMQRIRAPGSDHVWMFAPFALAGPLSIVSLIDSISNGTATIMSFIISTFLILMAAIAVYGFAHGTAASELEYWTGHFREILTLEWTDHYSSTDPVPNGALTDRDYPRAVRVFNRGSLITDHTSYWENEDEFISSLAASLGKLSGESFERVLGTPQPRMERAVKLRRLRVLYLAGARWLMLVAGAVAVATHPAEWSLLMEWARQKVASWAVAILPSELSWPVAVTARPTPAIVAETVGWLVALAAAHYVVFLMWRWWENEEVDFFFSGSPRGDRDPSKKMIVFLGASVAPLAFTLWLCLPDLLRDRGEAMFFVSFAVMVVAGVVYLGASKRRAKSAGVRPSDGQTAAPGRGRE